MVELEFLEQLHDESLYDCGDPRIMEVQNACLEKLHQYNQLSPTRYEELSALLKEMFAEIGENCYITPPFYANWGGRHVHFGKGVYCNFGCTFVDDTHIYVGDYCAFGPNVVVATAGHPVWPDLRKDTGLQYNAPVRIGNNCWIGAGTVIVPGVTIGDDTVIGAGSVVTKDIPSGVVAVGNPCRVLREVNDHDREYYFKNHKTPEELL